MGTDSNVNKFQNKYLIIHFAGFFGFYESIHSVKSIRKVKQITIVLKTKLSGVLMCKETAGVKLMTDCIAVNLLVQGET